MVDGKTFFEQAFKNYIKIYDKIQKITTGQGEDYTTVSILDYNYFNKHYKMIAKDLSKQQAFGADPKATQKIKFTGNLGFANYKVNAIYNWRSEGNHFSIFTRNCKSIVNLFYLNIIPV